METPATIAVIAAVKAQNEALFQALSGLKQPVESYAQVADLPPQGAFAAVIYVWQEGDHAQAITLAQRQNVFVLVPAEKSLSEDEVVIFSAVFKAPMPLGRLVDSVRLYQKQRLQREKQKPVEMGRYSLDPKTNMLNGDENNIRLTDKERDILLLLHTQQGAPVTRQDLLDHVWGYAEGVETHTLETHIYRLRQKIERDPSAPEFLMTNDLGYFLNL